MPMQWARAWRCRLAALRRGLETESARFVVPSMKVQLDRTVRVAGADLRRGTYRLVLIEREGGRGELCFLKARGKGPANLAAVAQVTIVGQRRDHTAVAVLRDNQDGTTTIAEINASTQKLLFAKQGAARRKRRRKQRAPVSSNETARAKEASICSAQDESQYIRVWPVAGHA